MTRPALNPPPAHGGLHTIPRLNFFAPNGTWMESIYQKGQLTAVTARDATGAQVTGTTYGYDSHGRQSTTTDAWKGYADLPETATNGIGPLRSV